MNISEAFPVAYFQNLSDDNRLVAVLGKLKSALQSRPVALDEQIEVLIDHLSSVVSNQAQDNLNAETITEIGELGSHLLERFYFESLSDAEIHQMVNFLALAFPYWVIRNEGSIDQLDFFVMVLAETANRVHDKTSLESLYEVATFIVFAVKDNVKLESEDPVFDNPWKNLIMNYGIIATRTHTPELMESAYKTLVQYFPEDAPGFFRQAMSEMDRLKYPPHVRVVVERYSARYNN